MTSLLVDVVVEALNKMLTTRGEPLVSNEMLLFANDGDIAYEGTVCRVRAAALIPAAKLEERFGPTLADGPSWIHANLIRGREGTHLVTLRFGAAIGAGQPSMNTSMEGTHKRYEVTELLNYLKPPTPFRKT